MFYLFLNSISSVKKLEGELNHTESPEKNYSDTSDIPESLLELNLAEARRLKRDLNFIAGEEFYEAYVNEHWELMDIQKLIDETKKQYFLSLFDPKNAVLPEVFNIHIAMPIDSFAEKYKFSAVTRTVI